jgi:hypothetical protein
MRHNNRAAILASLGFFCTLTLALPASAEPDATKNPNPPAATNSPTDSVSQPKAAVTIDLKPAEKTVSKPKPTVETTGCSQPKPPVYVADWARLAELTQSDSLIFPQADTYASRHEVVRHISRAGLVLGAASIAIGTFRRLSDEEWTNTSKWAVGTGIGLAVVTLFASWAIDPDRDDFLTLINHWNLRHPDLVMAP